MNLKQTLLSGVFLWCGVAGATQPTPPQVSVNASYAAKTILVNLVNQERAPITIELVPGSLSSISFESSRVRLEAGQKNSVKLAVREALRGRQVLHLETRVVFDKENIAVSGPAVYQPMSIVNDAARNLSYEEAFLKGREAIAGKSEVAQIDLGGARYSAEVSRLAFKAGVLSATDKIETVAARDPREYAKLKPKQLPSDTSLNQGGRGIHVRELFELESQRSSLTDVSRFEDENFSVASISPLATVVKGRMSLKTAPSTFKAAWGWVVRAWQNVGGNWVFLGWTYVSGDGSWQIALSNFKPGAPVRIEYQTKNRFVSLQDANGNPYTWGDNWNVSGATTDIGSRYADLTVNGDLPGVDRLYVGATNVWVKFFNNGMNALRDEPIQVFFPNTLASGKCKYDNGSGPYAWSCSYWGDGKIYIIPEHASPSVVQHEIAHSINSYYWDGNMPKGAGGTHNLTSCYNEGLALTEGFANFVTYWTQFDRSAASAVAPYFNMNIEAIPANVCAKQTAEMRVAAAFWDLYDLHSDGPDANHYDGLYFINQAVPVAMYLNNRKEKMSDYLPVTQSGQSSFWQGELTKLFRLNFIVP